MSLPSNISTGRVTGQFIVGVTDGDDGGEDPDFIPAAGSVIFTASVPYVPNLTAIPNPVTVLQTSIVAVLDSAGYLCTPRPGTLDPGYRGIRLIATDDADLSVVDWTWNATYRLAAVAGSSLTIPTHSFALPSGAVVDLTTVVNVPSSPGIGTEQAEALAASAQAAAVSAAQSAATASAAAQVTDGNISGLVSTPATATAVAVKAIADTAAAPKADTSALTAHTSNTANPHAVTKAQVGLSNVDNTSDVNKPVSAAQQTALDAKAPLASPAFTGTPTGITKTHVGLGSVDNTADVSKPVATGTVNGIMSAVDKAKLDAATSTSGIGTIMLRSSVNAAGIGTIYLDNAPVTNSSATRKDYVDAGLNTKVAKVDLGYNVKDYGAIGNGVANDSGAVQSALTAAAQGGVLRFPAGTYYMGSTPISAVLAGPLSIQGNGVAKLVWDTGNGILLTQNDANHTVTVDGLTLLTRAAGLGVALEIVGTGQNATGANLRPRTRNRGSITRVNIGGITDTATDGWAKGIRLLDIMNFFVNKVHIDGYAGPTAGSYVSTHGIEMVTNPTNAQAVDVVLSEVFVYFVQYGLDVQGYEGVMTDQCSFIGVGTGFRFDSVDAATPLASFTNGQIAFINKGFDFYKINQGVISDSLIYVHPAGGNPNGTGVSLQDVTTTRVTGCTFVSNVGMLTGVSISGVSLLNVVEACTFYANITNPVNLSASTYNNKVHNLILGGDATQVVINSAGTANQIESEKTPVQLRYATAGAKGETLDRRTLSSISLSALTSGTMHMTAVWLTAGTVVTAATFVAGGSPASGFTNRWFALYDGNRALLRTTADNATSWSPGTPLTIPFASTYTVPYDRLCYIGICEVATTPTVLRGLSTTPNVIGLAPILNGNGSTGLTNAASTPTPSPALTVSSNLPYAYIS